MYLTIAGWIVVVALLVIAQQRFYSVHRDVHHEWTLRQQRLGGKFGELVSATFRTDSDPGVERARRRYLVVMGLAVVYLLVGVPLGIWLESIVRGLVTA